MYFPVTSVEVESQIANNGQIENRLSRQEYSGNPRADVPFETETYFMQLLPVQESIYCTQENHRISLVLRNRLGNGGFF